MWTGGGSQFRNNGKYRTILKKTTIIKLFKSSDIFCCMEQFTIPYEHYNVLTSIHKRVVDEYVRKGLWTIVEYAAGRNPDHTGRGKR